MYEWISIYLSTYYIQHIYIYIICIHNSENLCTSPLSQNIKNCKLLVTSIKLIYRNYKVVEGILNNNIYFICLQATATELLC